VTLRKYLAFLVPLVLAALACTCNSQELFPSLAPTPTLDIDVDAEDALLIALYQQASPAVVYIKALIDADDTLAPLVGGAGFVIDEKGHIVTNNHVIEGAAAIQINFSDGSVVDADILGQDPYSDLAVLQVDTLPSDIVPLEMGDSSTLQVGQRVIAIGNPFGLEGTMTVGIVSGVGRTLAAYQTDAGTFSIPEVIQTDAAINPGNSGGPLLDSQGKVVGVNTAIRSSTGVNSGIGFAVPVNIVKRIIPHLIKDGSYPYPYLGISSDRRLTLAELARPLDLPVTRGVLISGVAEGGAADLAGLRGGDDIVQVYGMEIIVGGDIIVAIDGYELQDFADLVAYLVRETEVGQTVELTIIRDKEELVVPVTLGERP
jgi:S1-C subfamily serine protease